MQRIIYHFRNFGVNYEWYFVKRIIFIHLFSTNWKAKVFWIFPKNYSKNIIFHRNIINIKKNLTDKNKILNNF